MAEFETRIVSLIKSGMNTDELLSTLGYDPKSLPAEFSALISSLMSIIATLSDKLDCLDVKMDAMNDAIADLKQLMEEKNRRGSRNSSMPPSSEGYQKPNRKRSVRESSGRKPGGQQGHKGHGLAKVAADETKPVYHYPKECVGCSNFEHCVHAMACIATGHVYETRTVIVDNEHKAYGIVCPRMRKRLSGCLPAQVRSSQQYGTSIRSFILQLWSQGIMSIDRIAGLVRSRLGLNISPGTVFDVIARAPRLCAEAKERIRSYLERACVKGADETGMRVDGHLMWLHTVCDGKVTYLYADEKRGFKAIEDEDLLLDASGVLVHDCWGAYFKLENLEHAICLQHIQRELRAAGEREKGHKEYFDDVKKLLLKMRKVKLDAIEDGRSALTIQEVGDLRRRWRKLVAEGLEKFPKPKRKSWLGLGRIPNGKTRSLLLRLQEYEDCIFMFLENFDVGFSNNESERSLRTAKVRRSVSKCFRTPNGLSVFADLHSVLDSAAKLGIDKLKMIEEIFEGTAAQTLEMHLCALAN